MVTSQPHFEPRQTFHLEVPRGFAPVKERICALPVGQADSRRNAAIKGVLLALFGPNGFDVAID
jgi:hypothetical protein